MTIIGLIFPEEEKKFRCDICGKEYKGETALEKHKAEKHGKE